MSSFKFLGCLAFLVGFQTVVKADTYTVIVGHNMTKVGLLTLSEKVSN